MVLCAAPLALKTLHYPHEDVNGPDIFLLAPQMVATHQCPRRLSGNAHLSRSYRDYPHPSLPRSAWAGLISRDVGLPCICVFSISLRLFQRRRAQNRVLRQAPGSKWTLVSPCIPLSRPTGRSESRIRTEGRLSGKEPFMDGQWRGCPVMSQ